MSMSQEERKEKYFDAIDEGNTLNVVLYLGADVDIDETIGLSETALMYAIQVKELEVASLLIDLGASLTRMDARKYTAISYAINGGHIKLVEKILDMGFGINDMAFGHFTALYVAVAAQNEEMVNLLLARGADPKKSHFGIMSALDLAKGYKGYSSFYDEILPRLESYTK